MKQVLGLDIGGANIKAASTLGSPYLHPFPLWKQKERLVAELETIIERQKEVNHLAVTMTGELCDCFANKSEGVRFIAGAVEQAARKQSLPVSYYTQQGHFINYEDVTTHPLSLAAANWLASATFAGRFTSAGFSLFLDMGSTTTDIVPLNDDVPIPKGRDDFQRLRYGELLYQGASRTPVCAVLQQATWRGESIPLATEFFASVGDAYHWLNKFSDDPNATDTADGNPRTRPYTKARLARMFCADAEQFTDDDTTNFCEQIRIAQVGTLVAAIQSVVKKQGKGRPYQVILAGSGEFLIEQALEIIYWKECRIVSFREKLGAGMSQAAAAYAVAMLLREQII